MKSNEAVEREIKALADLWNFTVPKEHKRPDDPMNLIAGAMYDALQWARGRRVPPPSESLLKRWRRLSEGR